MKDSLNTLFRDRFQGHELPVGPAVWQGIAQQMANAATVSGTDGMSDLFKERFQGHETAVDPAVWQGISAQLGHTVVGTATGSSFLGWAAAGVVAVTVGTVAYFTLGEPKPTPFSAIPGAPSEQIAPIPMPEAPVAELTSKTTQPVSQEATGSRPATTKDRHAPARIKATSGPVTIEPIPAHGVVPNSAVQPPPPTKEGTAVVESIIAGITTEVKQQVREQQVRTQPTAPGPASNEPDAAVQEPEVAAMPELFVPNTFTPNGDGKNDEYQIGSEGFSEVLIRVYSVKDNRLVFSSTNSQEKWLGTNCEDGMYLVAVEARTPDGRTTTEGKVVWLNRNQMN